MLASNKEHLERWMWYKWASRNIRKNNFLPYRGRLDIVTSNGLMFDFKTVRPRGEQLRGRYQR